MSTDEHLDAETGLSNAGLRIRRITVNSGLSMVVPDAAVVCVVGGNNVGKSSFLREVVRRITSPSYPAGLLVESVQYDLEFRNGDVAEWLEENGVMTVDPTQGHVYRPSGLDNGASHTLAAIRSWVNQEPPYLDPIPDWFIGTLDSARRASLATGALGMVGLNQTLGGPLYALWRDGGREQEFSDICLRTFGFPLTLDRVTGNVHLRVGKPGVESPSLQNPTREYGDAVEALPSLHEQGDGVKNYLGMVLHLMTANEGVTVIDEPEAFLHPAQARALGRHLGEQALDKSRQLLTATHDRDFVLGLLETECPVTILRINRTGNSNTFAALSPEVVRSIWDKPALRYSNLIQGLFHRAVVVCEGDPDCRWYAAVLDHMSASRGFAPEEALFVPAGGKGQLPGSLLALDSLELQAYGILDFDCLYDVDYMEKLADARGIEPERLIQLSRAIRSQLNDEPMRKRAKQLGLRGLPAGNCPTMAKEMIDLLARHRILIVPVGELESFDNEIGGHASQWVTGALEKGLHTSAPEAEQLLSPVVAALQTR
ncbi:hypothetical protein ABIC47_003026 [Leifsonia sp. 563]|uniref:ATP-dependent nuclease n=1 Tax=Leifsonia sp. 563 TaxID=3156412 RepID=UPI003392DF4D